MKNNPFWKTLILFFLLSLFSFSSSAFNEETVLLELKSTFSDTNDDPESLNHCSWYGVSCNSDLKVVSLILRGCDGGQGSLHFPDLISCSCRGEISPGKGDLSEIRVLPLALKDLGGEKPKEIWGLEELELCFHGLKGIKVSHLGFTKIFLAKSTKSGFLNPRFLTNFGKSWKISEIFGAIKSSIFSSNVEPRKISKLINGIKLRKLMNLDEENFQNEVDESTQQHPSGKTGLYPIEIASIVSASVIVFVLLILVILFIYTRKWKRNSQIQVAEIKEIKVFVDIGAPLTYETIVRATGYFSNSNCIGHGGFGSTYKAEVSPNNILAIKRLSVGRFQGDQQFHAEISALEMVRHPNLVMLVGYHASETEMFLIYNYLSGGNLEDFIKERSKIALDWRILHKIALDVARALAYLHEECSPKVLHRDIKPSNILLDNNNNAYLSDFGLSKLLGTSQSHVTTGVAGTFGYVAPEYAMTCRVSEKADVYSYGIVLLELISDKRALDPSFSTHENGFNIVSWAHMMLSQGKAKEVFTNGLWETGPQDDLVEVLHLALKCTVDSLSIRPTMKQAVKLLKRIQPYRL